MNKKCELYINKKIKQELEWF